MERVVRENGTCVDGVLIEALDSFLRKQDLPGRTPLRMPAGFLFSRGI
jgi:hypothetical protein